MSSSNSCFLTCIQISQEAGKVVWYSYFLKNFPQFVVIHTVKGFGIVNKAEIDVFLELSCFLMIHWMLAIWSLVPLPFLNPAWTSGSSWFTYCWSLAWKILSITLLACERVESPYNYTVEVTNRFKGLDLTECLEELWMEVMTLYRRQWSRPSPRKGNAKRQNGCMTKPYK